jgi:outer membrane protein insertion porin family
LSCSTTKNLENKDSLLAANKITIVSDSSKNKKSNDSELASSLTKILPQQPNKKFLNVWPFKLNVYNMVTRKGDVKGKFKLWMRDKVGQPPVIFDSLLLETSESRMNNVLFNNGYFYGNVKSTYVTNAKKTKVNYNVITGKQYKIQNIYRIPYDSVFLDLVNIDSSNSFLKKGMPYSVDALKKERERISTNFKNNGYFAFRQDFIVFEADTSPGNYLLDIYMYIKKDTENVAYNKYYFGDINFYLKKNTNSNVKNIKNVKGEDTIRKIFFHIPGNDIKPDLLVRSIFYDVDTLFRADKYTQTINRLSDLGVFKFNKIRYTPFLISQDEGLINVDITSEMLRKQSWRTNLEMYTDDRKVLGTGLSFSYINKNIFKRADRFEFNINTGLELAFNNIITNKASFNSVNISTASKLFFPKFFPSFVKKKNEYDKYAPLNYKPTTFFQITYGFQRRLGNFNYLLHNANISYGYDWKPNKRMRHEITPVFLTLQKPKENSFNQAFIDYLNNSRLNALLFSQQFILGQEYAFSYSSQDLLLGKIKNFFFFRGTLNTSGNILFGIQSAIKGKLPEGEAFKLAGIKYAQFARIEADYKHYLTFKNMSSLVGRVFVGVGIPYGNAKVLPFVKQYAAGGPQSMRAWQFRSLGPGSLALDSGSTDFRTGDMQFESNIEYRFNILKKTLRGAIFADVGNVWLYNSDEAYPNANFDFKSLGKQLALDVGWGIRLDFGLFIIRIDRGYKIIDPNRIEGDRFINEFSGGGWSKWRKRYGGTQFGIGYPF